MTRLSCRFSTGTATVLWCRLLDKPALKRCMQFCYEPGSDEAERKQLAPS